jgi:hypothetical protein
MNVDEIFFREATLRICSSLGKGAYLQKKIVERATEPTELNRGKNNGDGSSIRRHLNTYDKSFLKNQIHNDSSYFH